MQIVLMLILMFGSALSQAQISVSLSSGEMTREMHSRALLFREGDQIVVVGLADLTYNSQASGIRQGIHHNIQFHDQQIPLRLVSSDWGSGLSLFIPQDPERFSVYDIPELETSEFQLLERVSVGSSDSMIMSKESGRHDFPFLASVVELGQLQFLEAGSAVVSKRTGQILGLLSQRWIKIVSGRGHQIQSDAFEASSQNRGIFIPVVAIKSWTLSALSGALPLIQADSPLTATQTSFTQQIVRTLGMIWTVSCTIGTQIVENGGPDIFGIGGEGEGGSCNVVASASSPSTPASAGATEFPASIPTALQELQNQIQQGAMLGLFVRSNNDELHGERPSSMGDFFRKVLSGDFKVLVRETNPSTELQRMHQTAENLRQVLSLPFVDFVRKNFGHRLHVLIEVLQSKNWMLATPAVIEKLAQDAPVQSLAHHIRELGTLRPLMCQDLLGSKNARIQELAR